MGVFTPLGATELAAVAERFGLGSLTSARTIAAGTINSNFELATARGRWFARVNEGKSEADVAWEAELVAALADGGVLTPPPVRADDGRPYVALPERPDKWISVFPWRGGRHLEPGEVTAETAADLGRALGELHRVGLARPPESRRASIYDHAHLVARFARFAGSVDPALAPAIATIGAELARVESAAEVRRGATVGIIHGDLFRDNVLWEAGRVTALLDFEQASGGSLAYDLAVCINDWCWDGAPRLDRVAALLRGYEAARPLTAGDRAALPIEVRAAATRFTITRITDVYLAAVPNPEKDFRAFLARCVAWQGPALGQLRSLL